MTDQPTLFAFDVLASSACQYAQFAGSYGYGQGCRCSRCVKAKKNERERAKARPSTCAAEGCSSLRLKHRRWCEAHLPPPKPSRVRLSGTCEVCGRGHEWYESVNRNLRPEIRDLYRRVCPTCRHRYVDTIKSHRLNVEWAMRLIRTTHCDLCGERIPMDAKGHRLRSVVDHDHGCCPGSFGCDACVRGILCNRCNLDLGYYEAMRRRVGLDALANYVSGVVTPGRF